MTASSTFLLGRLHSTSSAVDRLELSDNFNRWRFMQNFLDAEIEASDANEVLYSVLDSFLKQQRHPKNNDNDDSESSEVVSPQQTPQVRATVEELLLIEEGTVRAFQDPDCSPGDVQVLEKIEALLPDPQENEDAFKGSWDTILELHGREAVRINEEKGSAEWKALCTVARVLVYFDFMTKGVPSSTTSSRP